MGCSSSSANGGAPDVAGAKANGTTKANSKSGGHRGPQNESGGKAKILGGNEKENDKAASMKENRDYQLTMTFLSQVPLLKRLPRDQNPLLAAACIAVEFKAGAVIINQGDSGAEFFVIKSGEARVMVLEEDGTQKQVALLKTGDYFGENALLRDEPRTATIIADSAMSTLKITRDEFQRLGLHERLHFATRKAVGGGDRKQNLAKPPSPKTDKDRKLISQALKSNQSLQAMVNLDDSRIESLIDVAWKEEVPAGKDIIVQDDLEADFFYIVHEGTFEIHVTDPEDIEVSVGVGNIHRTSSTLSMGSKLVSRISEGGSFGELALLYLVPRAATVKAAVKSVVWVIDRNNFKNILMKVSQEKEQEYIGYINNVAVLQTLLADEKKAIAQAFVEMYFTKDEIILQQGEQGKTFYILYDGEVKVIVDGDEKAKLSASHRNGTAQFFGERALLNNEPRAATIIVKSEFAKVLTLDRDSFTLLLGPLEDLINRSQGNPVKLAKPDAASKAKAAGMLKDDGQKILKKDLQRIGLLGCGGFGAVELWEHKVTKQTYALKGLSKGYIVKTGMQESVMNEKAILMMTNSAFIIKLYATYNGSQTLYFLLEPALGGELYATYNRKGFHGSEKHAKYYVAGVVFAFEHCHERRIIYRDLKPENLLFTEHGHLKVTDMGLAKFVIGKTFTTCGTPDYFAPELIASTGHTNAVDWWTLGILLYELMSGNPPFASAFPMQIYSKVMKGINQVQFPAQCQGKVGDLIKSLLKKDPSERLPMRPGGTKNLKQHKWYQDFNWDSMERLELEPPYKPNVKGKKDIANFHARKEDMPKHVEFKDDGTGWDKDFATS